MRPALPILVLALTALGVWFLQDRRPEPPRDAELRPEAAGVAGAQDLAPARRPPEETSVDLRAEPGSTGAEPSPRGWLVRGEVVDLLGSPVAEVEVGVPGASARTNARGRFGLRASRRGVRVEPLTARLAVVARESRRAQGELQRLVVAPAMGIAGMVVDEVERPLRGVRVEVELDLALPDLPTARDLLPASWTATSDADGSFELERLPAGVPGRVRLSRADRRTVELPLPERERRDLRVRMPAGGAGSVAGRVVTEAGDAVEGAWVAAGGERARSDADGRFRLDLADAPADVELVATHPEHGTARLTGEDPAGDLVLVLRQPSGLLAGVLLDPEGSPLAGWRVSILRADDAGGVRDSLSGELRAQESCETDAEGRFVLRGEFEAEELWLKAWGKAARTTATLGPVAGGSDGIVWTVAAARFREPSSAVVAAPDGRPIAGACVTVAPLLEAAGGTWAGHPAQLAVTGAAGDFLFASAPRGPVRIAVSRAGFDDALVDVAQGEDLPARIELPRLCDVAVQATLPDLSLAFLDASGRRLEIRRAFSGAPGGALAELDPDRPQRFLVGESARTMVTYQGGTELYRRPVRLRPDVRTTLQP